MKEEFCDITSTLVILAGGRSSRMGADKRWIYIDGHRLIDRQVEELGALFERIMIVTEDELRLSHSVEYLSDKGLFSEERPGPLAALWAAMNEVRDGYLYLLACDMPFFSPDLVKILKDAIFREGHPRWCGFTTNDPKWGVKRQPFHAFYHAGLREALRTYLETGKRRMGEWIAFIDGVALDIKGTSPESNTIDYFTNLNYSEDLERTGAEIRKSPSETDS